MWWIWWRKDKQQEVKPEFLKPGDCECGHSRCCHKDGRGACSVVYDKDDDGKPYPADEHWTCACLIYIPDDDDENDDTPDVPNDPEVVELERMMQK